MRSLERTLCARSCGGIDGIPGLLLGRKVLVTGGSRGIGASIVRSCAMSSAFVGFTYMESKKKAESLVEELGGSSVRSYMVDTADLDGMVRVAEDLSGMGEAKGIHGLVCNAGIYERKDFSDLDLDSWERTMRVNLEGAFISVKATLPVMEHGSIVLISSQIAQRGTRHGADYAASKAGLLGLCRSLALELSPRVRVNAVLPGYIDTDLISSDTPERRRVREEEVPLGRVGRPVEVADGVLFLLSDLSSYMTGSVLDMTGGLLLGR